MILNFAETSLVKSRPSVLNGANLFMFTSHNLALLDCGLAVRRKPRSWPNTVKIGLVFGVMMHSHIYCVRFGFFSIVTCSGHKNFNLFTIHLGLPFFSID